MEGEIFLKAFNRTHESGAFTGQLNVQGNAEKQTKYLDEFLIYPPFEKIDTKMTLYEQDEIFHPVHYVKSHTSDGFRDMPITPKAQEILNKLNKLNQNDDFILINEGNPLTTNNSDL